MPRRTISKSVSAWPGYPSGFKEGYLTSERGYKRLLTDSSAVALDILEPDRRLRSQRSCLQKGSIEKLVVSAAAAVCLITASIIFGVCIIY